MTARALLYRMGDVWGSVTRNMGEFFFFAHTLQHDLGWCVLRFFWESSLSKPSPKHLLALIKAYIQASSTFIW